MTINSAMIRGTLCFLALAAGTLTAGSLFADEPAPRKLGMTQENADGLRRVLDDAYPKLVTVIDRWSNLPAQGRDFRGKTAAQDLRSDVLPTEERERIDRLRADADHQVVWAEIWTSSGHGRLDSAALNFAVKGAKYLPARDGGRAVPATMVYIVNFELGPSTETLHPR